MIYIIAGAYAQAAGHARARDINPQMCTLITGMQSLHLLNGRKYNSEEDKIWFCSTFWNLPTRITNDIQDRMAIITNKKWEDIEMEEVC
jgi:hypothetical protein